MANGKVLDFGGPAPEEPDSIWVCHCQCQTFFLHKDKTIECAGCGCPVTAEGGWMRPRNGAPDVNPEAVQTVRREDQDFMHKRIAQQVLEDDVAFVVLALNNGSVKTSLFQDDDLDADQQAWVERRMEEAKGLLSVRAGRA